MLWCASLSSALWWFGLLALRCSPGSALLESGLLWFALGLGCYYWFGLFLSGLAWSWPGLDKPKHDSVDFFEHNTFLSSGIAGVP